MITPTLLIDLLRQEDIEGLIEMGAPSDEYDSEAEEVVTALAEESLTEEKIVSVISSVWSASFNLDDEDIEARLPAFRIVATALLAGEKETRE